MIDTMEFDKNAHDLPISETTFRSEQFNRFVTNNIRPACAGLSVFYGVLAVGHTLLLASQFAVSMSLLAAATSIFSAILVIYLGKREIHRIRAYPLFFAIALLVFVNSLAMLYTLADPNHAINLIFCMIGIGCLLLSKRWPAAAVAAAGFGWLAGGLASPRTDEWSQFGFALFATTILSMLVFYVRIQGQEQMKRFRQLAEEQRAAIEDSLRTSNEGFRLLAESAHAIVMRYRFGPTFHIEHADASILEMTGYTQDEFYADPSLWHRLVQPDDLGLFADALTSAHAEGKPFIARLSTKQGATVWVEHHVRPIADGMGRTVGGECVAFDVSSQKKNEMAVLRSEERLRIALEAAGLAIWEWELNTGRMSWAPSLETLLGLTDTEVKDTYRDFVRVIHADHRERVIAGLDRARRTGAPFESQCKLQRADGTFRWVSLRTGFLVTDRCIVQSVMGTIVDIHQEKQANEALARALSLLNATLDSTPDGILATDLEGQTVAVNARFHEIWAGPGTSLAPRKDGLAFDITDIIEANLVDPPAHLDATLELFSNPELNGFHVLKLKDGRTVERYSQPQRINSTTPVGRVWTFRDVSHRVRAEDALRKSEERYKLATLGANDGIWDWEIQSNRIFLSQRWKGMLGYDDGDLSAFADAWFRLIHPDDLELFETAIQDNLSGESVSFECEHRMHHRDGSYLWMLTRGAVVRDAEGKPLRMAGSQTDITQRKLTEERLQHDAYHDPLTGLANRAMFHRAISRSLRRFKAQHELFAVLFIDLDRFKVVNDSLGHLVGDQLLISLGRRIESVVRPGDTVARLGGDEFIILLDRLACSADAITVTERILCSLNDPFILNGNEVYAGASIGVALIHSEYDLPEDIMRDADAAMYRAKEAGKGRYAIFDSDMHAQSVGRLEIECDLRHALERNEFEVYYQPIVCVISRRLKGFEALVRWNHPTKGLLPPKDFIALAEDTGLIQPIGQWVLGESCRQLAAWRAMLPNTALTVSVNISPRSFHEPELVSSIAESLTQNGLPADALHIEITEGLLMDPHVAGRVLQNLKNLGVSIHLDDFGTGFSSLGYLQKYPVDTLKIDRSFTEYLGVHHDAEAIVRAIADLAHNLGIGVIAEGIENIQQLKLIQSMGCDAAQGFLFAEPLNAADATVFIAEPHP